MGENLQIFKMCRLGNPSFMKQLRALHPGADGLTFIQHEVEKLIDIPFIDELTVKMLIKELPAYFKYADEFAGDWLFKPPTAPTTVAEVQLFKKKRINRRLGLRFWVSGNSFMAMVYKLGVRSRKSWLLMLPALLQWKDFSQNCA